MYPKVVKIITVKEDNLARVTAKINLEIDGVDQDKYRLEVRGIRLSQTSAGHRVYYATLVVYAR